TIERAAREVFDFDPPTASGTLTQRWRYVAVGVVTGVLVLGGATLAFDKRVGNGIANPTTSARAASAATPGAVRKVAALAPPAVRSVSPPARSAEPPAVTRAKVPPDFVNTGVPITLGVDSRDLNAAFRHLARQWQMALVEGEPCQMAQRQQVYCFTSNKGLAEIRLLDRPGILTLRDDAQEKYYALLVGLSADRAMLRIGEATETVSLPTLAHRWGGEFTTFWRGPAGYRKDIARGDRGAAVDWLAEQVAAVRGAPRPEPGAVYDGALAAQVREFQLAQGLRPDGLAGPQTLMRLASLNGSTEPHLQVLAQVASANGK
ncbi:MAG: peptidoglycan-binding protein, partial [Pseudomonadota bacterium]|nr:peptidoglycan-binding protein [Pseudomonadota bacterium]